MNKIKIGLFGYGVVGKGVDDLILNHSDQLNIEVSKIFGRENKRELLKDRLVTDMNDIIYDDTIRIVIECLGGDELPYLVIKAALSHKKDVITSNKETVALHYYEYLKLAKENHVSFLFEASCGAGIPLLHPLIQIAKFDRTKSFKGILNGSTNFIISKMSQEDMPFDKACQMAHELGYLEANPDADLLGLDMMRKGVIISNILYQTKIHLNEVSTFGIKKLNLDMIHDIQSMNKVLKMIVEGYFKNDQFYLSIMPVLLNKEHPLSHIQLANNGVSVDFTHNGLLTFNGLGAGRYPTASGVLQDLISLLDGPVSIDISCEKEYPVNIDLNHKYYMVKNNQKRIVDSPSLDELKNADFIARIEE